MLLFCMMLKRSSLLVIPILVFIACKTQKPVASNSTPANTPSELIIQDTLDTAVLPIDSLEHTDSLHQVSEVIDTVLVTTTKKERITITGVGDIMLGTNFPETYYLPPNMGRDMLSNVSHIFDSADIVFGNLEGVILDSGGLQKQCRNPKACYLFRSPKYMGSRLKESGFNLMSVANNHAGDFGEEGRTITSQILDSLGIYYAGSINQPWHIFEKEGIKYGFAAFSPNKGTPNINNIGGAIKTVEMLDSLVDVVIVSFHGGAEGKDYTTVPREHEYFYGEDRGDVYHFSHAMIDAGADVIFGHGPHVPRAIEVYKKRFIAYSLGNFATYARFNLIGDNSLAPIAKLTISNQGEFLSGQIISCKQLGRGIPSIDLEHSAAKRIWELTKKDIPEVQITIDQSGFISYLHN